jgi:type I restriction enzyme M protein
MKDEIKTHPQFRISLSSSDERKSYPVDVAVFEKNKLKIICECKKLSSREGKE